MELEGRKEGRVPSDVRHEACKLAHTGRLWPLLPSLVQSLEVKRIRRLPDQRGYGVHGLGEKVLKLGQQQGALASLRRPAAIACSTRMTEGG